MTGRSRTTTTITAAAAAKKCIYHERLLPCSLFDLRIVAIWAIEAMQKASLRTNILDIPLGVRVEEIEVEEEHWTQAPNSS